MIANGFWTLFKSDDPLRHRMRVDHMVSEMDRVLLADQMTREDFRIRTAPIKNVQNEFFEAGYAALGGLTFAGCERPDAHIFQVESLPHEDQVIILYEEEEADGLYE